MLELENITFSFRSEEGTLHKILDHVSFKAEKGEFILVLGKNGAGKSSLLNLIAGESLNYTGTLKINQQRLKKISSDRRARWVAKVSQNSKEAVIDEFTIEENLSFAYLRGQKRRFKFFRSHERRNVYQEKLKILGMNLENRLCEKVKTLSGGQKQALSLVMATLAQPEVLLLDEHTSALDPKMGERLMEITEKIIQAEKITTLMISHNLSHISRYGDRFLILKGGRVIRDSLRQDIAGLTAEEIKNFYE
jgi:putative ABC transport system ATP-binding protein